MSFNPTSETSRLAEAMLSDPSAANLSPASVQALSLAKGKIIGQLSPAEQTAFAQATQEALQKGYKPEPGLIPALKITLGIVGGALTAGALTAALAGGAAAGAAGAAGGGAISSATAPSLFAGQAASDIVPAATGGSSFGNALLNWGSKAIGGPAGVISTGLNVLGGALSSSAAKDAAKTQSEAAQKAIDQLGPMYAPYQQVGQQGLGNLQNFLSGGQQPQQPTPAALPNGWQPINGYGQLNVANNSGGVANNSGGVANNSQWMGNLGNLTAQSGMMPRPGASPGGLVTLKAPDGTTRQVPQSGAQAMIQASGGRLAMVQ